MLETKAVTTSIDLIASVTGGYAIFGTSVPALAEAQIQCAIAVAAWELGYNAMKDKHLQVVSATPEMLFNVKVKPKTNVCGFCRHS